MKRAQPSYLHARERSTDRGSRPMRRLELNLDDIIDIDQSDCSDMESSRSSSPVRSETGSTYDDTVSVFLRLRPVTSTLIRNPYKIQNNVLVAKCADETGSLNKDFTEKHFTFTDIFLDEMSQISVYDKCIRSALNNVTSEQGATFMTYGTSGSGKTYTLLGSQRSPGIVPRAIEHIFTENELSISVQPSIKVDKNKIIFLDDDNVLAEKRISENLKIWLGPTKLKYAKTREVIRNDHNFIKSNDTNTRVYIWISFVEIYNEQVYDLLSQDSLFGKREPLKILANDGNAYIKDMCSIFVKTSEEAYDILQYGLKGASYGATDINSNSSRSHSIFFITVLSYSLSNQNVDYATYKFCDLAGSERLKKTGNIGGGRLKEAQKINTSLMVLGRCLESVHRNQKSKKIQELVPVRDSKLTMLLQSALLGKEKLSMIVNMYLADDYYEENLIVLNFSSIAKQIHVQKLPLKRNYRSTRYSTFLAQATSSPSSNNNFLGLQSENDYLKNEVERLQQALEDQELESFQFRELLSTKEGYIQKLRLELIKQEGELRNELIDDFESYTQKREGQFKVRLQQAKDSAILPYVMKINYFENKIEKLKKELNEFEYNENLNEMEINALKEKLKKYENHENRCRRMSL